MFSNEFYVDVLSGRRTGERNKASSDLNMYTI